VVLTVGTELRKTKFSVPSTKPGLVPRSHLSSKLIAGLVNDGHFSRKLTLISAPAGFGKTTLLMEWLHDIDFAYSWVALDKQDNDISQFWACIIEALQQKAVRCGQALLSAVRSGGPNVSKEPREDLIVGLINDLADLDSPLLLVLDDYHLITSRRIHSEVAFLVDHLPPQLHVAIATRSDPDLPLARLRARAELAEIRQADLKFTTAETSMLMKNLAQKELSSAEARELTSRTEGWVVGLQMAAVTLRNKEDAGDFIRSFSGSNRFVLDYLSEEILRMLTEEKRRFLMYSSVLDQMTESLCQKVTGFENSQALLEELDRNNLFVIALDDQREWYRYHHLFAELLQHELRRREPEIIPDLHVRASLWHEISGDLVLAVEHAFAAADQERVIYLLDSNVKEVWGQGQQGALFRWLQKLSPHVLEPHLGLKLYYALLVIISGGLPEAHFLVKEVEAKLNDDQEMNEAEIQLYTGIIATIKGFAATISGNSSEIISNAEKALELLPRSETLWRGLAAVVAGDALAYDLKLEKAVAVYSDAVKSVSRGNNKDIYLNCSSKLAMCIWYQGKLQQVAQLSHSQLAFIDEEGIQQTAKAGGVYALWAEVLREWDCLDEALKLLQQSHVLGEREDNRLLLAWSHVFLLRTLYSRGEYDQVAAALDRMDRWSLELSFPRYAVEQIAPFRAKLYLARGGKNHDELMNLAEGLQFEPDRLHRFYNEEWIMTYCRLLDALGSTQK